MRQKLFTENFFILIVCILLPFDIIVTKRFFGIPIPFATTSLVLIISAFTFRNLWMPLLILTIPLRSFALTHFGPAQIRIGDMILLLIAFFWFIQIVSNGSEITIVRNRLDQILIIFILYNIISLFWAENDIYGVVRVLKFLRNWILFFLIREYLIKDFDRRYIWLIVLMLITGVLVSIPFVFSIYTHGALKTYQSLRAAATLPSNSLELAAVKGMHSGGLLLQGISSWLIICAYLGIGLFSRIKNKGLFILNLLVISILFALTVLSCSRAAWVSIAGSMLLFSTIIFVNLRLRQRFFLLLFVGCFAAFIFYTGFNEIVYKRLAPSVLTKDPSVTKRLDFYQEAITAFLKHPIFGPGVASIPSTSGGEVGWKVSYRAIHNLYLQILGELGIIGFSVFVWLLYLWLHYLKRSLRYYSIVHDKKNRLIVASIIGASVYYLLMSMTAQNFENMEEWILLSITSTIFIRINTFRKKTLLADTHL